MPGKIRPGAGNSPLPHISGDYLEITDLKDGFWVRKAVLLQVRIEASGRGAEVRDTRS